jgi:hypothetical protein
MHAAGAHVVVTDIQCDEAQRVADQLGRRRKYLPLDVTDPDQWTQMLSNYWPELRESIARFNTPRQPPADE